MTDLQFNIGDRVRVKATAYAFLDGENNRSFKTRAQEPPLEGWVVRATRRQIGVYHGPSNGYDPEDDVPAYLHVTSTILVYRVTVGIRRLPVDVLPEDLELIEPNLTMLVHNLPPGVSAEVEIGEKKYKIIPLKKGPDNILRRVEENHAHV